jgi:alkylation response protein AidB-like acyl-CoA dehydrogenase
MDFGLSEEQRLLADALAGFLEKELPPARVREIAASESGHDAGLWKALCEQGAAGVLVPEAFGGSGLGLLDACVASQALGYAAAPSPFLSTAVMAPLALASASPALQKEWLPRIATGAACFSVAANERWSKREGGGVREQGDRLAGKSMFALDASAADAFLVATDAGSLALVPRDAQGLALKALPTLDPTRRVAELVFESVRPAEWIGARGGAGAAIDRMLDAGRIAAAFDALGACDRALAMAVAYAKQRVQFGRVIGSFQAVKHLCAEMAAEIEPARSLLWYAAHAFDAVPAEAPLMASLAKSHLADVGRFVVRTATEVHGGIGFTDEHDLQLWFKRAHLDAQLLGGPELLRARAAELQGWSAAGAS